MSKIQLVTIETIPLTHEQMENFECVNSIIRDFFHGKLVAVVVEWNEPFFHSILAIVSFQLNFFAFFMFKCWKCETYSKYRIVLAAEREIFSRWINGCELSRYSSEMCLCLPVCARMYECMSACIVFADKPIFEVSLRVYSIHTIELREYYNACVYFA